MGGLYYLRPMISLFEKFPSSKIFFEFPLYYIAASQPLNLNNMTNLKQNPKIICMFSQRPIWSSFVEKTEDKKSRDTVPLKGPSHEIGIGNKWHGWGFKLNEEPPRLLSELLSSLQ
jgi:hypothetical protein